MLTIPAQFSGVTVLTKANVYFDGGVISHTLQFPDGTRKTLGLIRPGRYHFNTAAAERMELVAGGGTVQLDGDAAVKQVDAGQAFDVPANAGFSIEVTSGLVEYICSFLA